MPIVQKPLIVIVGPTASGKTKLAIELAKKYNGEIICADSRTIYKGMDIGTAKPTKQEQATVPHWGLDLVSPDETFTALDFKEYAVNKIADIRARNKIPFLVGGTGLYVDAVIFDYQFGPPPNDILRKKMELMSIGELHEYCKTNNIKLPENYKNKRYVIRSIELKNTQPKSRRTPIENSYIVGITTERLKLKERIQQRAKELFDRGVIEEASTIGAKYGWQGQAMTGNIYKLCHDYLSNKISRNELFQRFITQDWRLAKRQLTWLARNSDIHWLEPDRARQYIESILDFEQK